TIYALFEPTGPAEWNAHSLSRGSAAQEYAWRASPPVPPPYAEALGGAMSYPPPAAEDLDEFLSHMTYVLRSLAEDVPTLWDYTERITWVLSGPGEHFVQG